MELQTSRLLLDSLQASDAEALFGYRGDPQVGRFQGWQPASVAQAAAFIAEQAGTSVDTPDRWMQRAIRLRSHGGLIGDVGIHVPSDAKGSVEFGITISPTFQSQGFAREILCALIATIFGTLGYHRVHASVDPRNLPSMALLRALGMRQEAHHRESLWFKSEWADDVIFAMLDHEWRTRQAGQPHHG